MTSPCLNDFIPYYSQQNLLTSGFSQAVMDPPPMDALSTGYSYEMKYLSSNATYVFAVSAVNRMGIGLKGGSR